jgi:hypothetical protein
LPGTVEGGGSGQARDSSSDNGDAFQEVSRWWLALAH